jgi:hypothetical protein
MTATVFIGYDSHPEVTRETLFNATRSIAKGDDVHAVSWEELKTAGRVLIGRIKSQIDQSAACMFDVSTMNENVLFELGYSIARAKPVNLLLDRTDSEAKQRWKEFQLLKTVGYVGWANSDDIRKAFFKDRPDHQSGNLYDDLIEPELGATVPASILYVPTLHNTDPAREIERRLEHEVHRGVRLLTADPTESGIYPLSWYASKAYETNCTVVHFEAPRRSQASIHNARSALVAGIASGLDRPVLLLAEHDYSAPIDYEDDLQLYGSARECALLLDRWLSRQNLQPKAGARSQRVRLSSELRTLRFGEHVAENEIDTLAEYFIETSAFDDVLATRNALFVGRKGSGKTANMLQAAARLSEDVRNLVVVIKPASYEYVSLLELLSSLPVSLQQYSIESLWRFLLQSEIANQVVETIEARAPGIPFTEEEKALLEFVDESTFGLRDGFAARFEKTVRSISESGLGDVATDAEGRDLINEALHTQAIARLRRLLGPVLKSRQRVAVLIDNLDKGWERDADLKLLAKLLLGLLAAVGKVVVDFDREDYWRDRIRLTLATFLRSDIFAFLRSEAREPDKLPVSRLEWRDGEVLLNILEERFLAARPPDTDAGELWTRFFCETVRGQSTRNYLIERCLPRPRDIIFWCNAAVSVAANRRHQRVEEDDVIEGERLYSQFAFEALLVENGITVDQLQQVLFEFLGEPSVLNDDGVLALIRQASVDEEHVADVLSRLKGISFLGIETAPNRFEFCEHGTDAERAEVLARKLGDSSGASRLAIHPAFWEYIEVERAE